MRARAEVASLHEGLPLDLVNLVTSYGRDRRLSLRVERMPSRSRLSRGRNNGDGSWSLTRDELHDLFYFPPRGSNDIPTLVVRIIGLDSDNGATLEVVDATPGELPEDDEDADRSERHEAELKKLRAELAKAKATLRATQSDLTAARKAFEAELEERLTEAQAEAAAEAATELEKIRGKWQAEAKERLAKQDTRAEERLDQARESWRRETEAEIAKAEESWKRTEKERQAADETQWREQAARTLAEEKAAHAKTQAALAAVRKQTSAEGPKTRELSDEIERLQRTLAERDAAIAESGQAATAAREEASREKEQAARERKAFALKLQDIESRLAEAKASRDRSDTNETRRLRDDLAAAEAKLTEQRRKLAEAQTEAADARKEARELQSSLAKAEEEQKAADATRQRGAAAETKRLRAELAAMEARVSEKDGEIAGLKSRAKAAIARADELQAAVAKAAQDAKAGETSRLNASKAEWEARSRLESQRATAALEDKLRKAERALDDARLQARLARDSRDAAESHKFTDEIRALKATLVKRDLELAEALDEAKHLRESAKRDAEVAHAEFRKEWEAGEAARFAEAKAEWERHSSRVFKKAQIRLEAAEAALAEARAEAGTARDRRDSAEFRRLRAEFSAASTKLAEREAQLAEAQLAAGRARERTREEVEAAIAKAEEAWKSSDALRQSEIETRERERGARALAEAMARLERTEAALAEAKDEMEIERERTAVQLAEASARLEKTQTALTEANERIETMRDPVNETEVHRLRNELANLQIAYTDREAELAIAHSTARKARERGADHVRAAVLKAEDDWRCEEARRLEAAKQDWERQARYAAEMTGAPEAVSEVSATKRANRLLLDSALAVGLAAVVVLGVTFYWHNSAGGLPNASAALPPKPPVHMAPPLTQTAAAVRPMTVVASVARVRTAPETGANIAETVRRGVAVSLLERRGVWARVHVDSYRGKPPVDGWMLAGSLRAPSKP